jgi:hypothetical protein
MKNSLRKIKKDLSDLSLSELEQIKIWLEKYIDKAEDKIKAGELEPEVSIIEKNGKTYRLQHIRCGKETCKCATGGLHGPYWYAYWLEDGKTKSKYLGRKLPKSLTVQNSFP